MSCHVTFLWANWWIFNRRCLFSIYYIIKFYVLNLLKRSYCNNIKVKVVLVHFIQIRWRGKEKKKDQYYNNRNDNYGLSWESYPLVPSMNAFVGKGKMLQGLRLSRNVHNTIAKHQYELYIKDIAILLVPFRWLW